jgi:hypothetical protein
MDSTNHLDDDVMEPMPAEATIPPFDLHNPQAEDDYGAVDQGLIAGSMVGTDTVSGIPERDRYYKMHEQIVKLSVLRRLYEEGRGSKAFCLLKNKCRLEVDADICGPADSSRFTYSMQAHYIDFSLRVPDRVGFDAILTPPSLNINTTWCFNLNLLGSICPFLNNRGDLGFDPAGRMLWIGTHDHDNIFLAMAPRSFIEGDDDPAAPGRQSGPTIMSHIHVRMATCIILWAMGRIPNRDYSTHTPYIALEGRLDQYREVTDWVCVPLDYFQIFCCLLIMLFILHL